ncbi:MAG: PilZ domain-containing protein [Nitrospiraceae bacterium]
MKKNFGRVSRNASEEIRVWLQEDKEGELQVELRVYDRSAQGGGISLPEPEGLAVPIHALSELCQILEQVHEHLFKKDLVDVPSMRNLVTVDDPIKLHLVVDPPAPQPDTPSQPPVSVKLPVECYALDAPDTWPAEQVTGETRDLSSEGAQVWLPREFAAGSRLAVLIIIGELHFRGHAKVVGTAPSPQDGSYPHNLQWVSLSPQAKHALSKIIDTAK